LFLSDPDHRIRDALDEEAAGKRLACFRLRRRTLNFCGNGALRFRLTGRRSFAAVPATSDRMNEIGRAIKSCRDALV